MMKKPTRLSFAAITTLLTAVALSLSAIAHSQSPNPLYQHLLPSASHIYSIRLGQIIAKGELTALLGSIPVKDSNAAKFINIINDPASAGIDLSHEILIAQTTPTGNGADTLTFTQFLIPLTDSAKFRRVTVTAHNHFHRVPGKGAAVSLAKLSIVWNDRFSVVTQVSAEKRELGLEKGLASLAGYPASPLLTDQRFLAGFASDDDMHAWAPKADFRNLFGKAIKKMLARDSSMHGNPFQDYANSDQTTHPPILTTFNFANGRIVFRLTTYNSPEDAALFRRGMDRPFNTDLLARLPGGLLLGYSAIHFNPTVFPEIMERHHTSHLIDSVLGKQGLSVNDLSAIFGGDILIAAVSDTTAIADTTKKKVNMYFVATLGDPAKLMQLTAKLMAANNSIDTAKAAKMKKLANRMVIRDNILVISSSKEMAQKYFDNPDRRPIIIPDNKTPQYLTVDLKAVSTFLAASMSNNPKAMIFARILEKLDKIEMTSGLSDSGNTEVTFQIITGDPTTNSLKTLVSLLH
jgi:hypothetical protein